MAPPNREPADDWIRAWEPMVALVGQDFSDGSVVWGADAIEAGTIRRYLEPLEFDCALHYDREVARSHGYRDLIAPYTSFASFSLPAQWCPGKPLFTSAERDAQPAYSPLRGTRPAAMPPVSAFFATEYEADYLQPAVAGDLLGRRGNRLLRCEPKATRVGRGAFTTWEYEVINQRDERIARCRFGMYYYDPTPQGTAA